MTLKEALNDKFYDILKKDCYQQLIYQIAQDNQENPKKGLCNILLSFVPDNYQNAKNKILIMGREPRGWLDDRVFERYDKNTVIDSMQKSQNFFNRQLKTPQKGGRFFGFIQKVANHSGEDGLLWSNMFVISHNLTLPYKHPLFKDIKHLSKELLLAQIDVLRPDVIIFANGYRKAVWQARYEYFENLTWSAQSFDGLHHRYLQKCDLNLDFKNADGGAYQPVCYRTHHPSTRTANGKKGLTTLIKQLPTK